MVYNHSINDKFKSPLDLKIGDQKLDGPFKRFCEYNDLDQEEMYYFFYEWMNRCGRENSAEAQELKRILQYMKLKDTGEYAEWRKDKEDRKRREEMLRRQAQNFTERKRSYYHEPYYRLFHKIQLKRTRMKDLDDGDKQRAKTLIRKGAIKQSKLTGVLKHVDISKVTEVEMSEALTTSAVHNPPQTRPAGIKRTF